MKLSRSGCDPDRFPRPARIRTVCSGPPGLHNAKIGPNLAGGEYDLVFYADLDDRDALAAFRDHPLHVAHRERCASLVTGRLAGDLEV